MRKKTYLKDANMFILRQINNKINTMVVSVSVICLLLFMTITILSSALALRNTMQKELIELTPADLNLYKTANLPESYTNSKGKEIKYKKAQIDDSRISIKETLVNHGFNMELLKDVEEASIYTDKNLSWKDFLGTSYQEIKSKYPRLLYDTQESIIKISDYNRMAKVYGIEQYELEEDEYIVVCDYDYMINLRNEVLKNGEYSLKIAGKLYHSKYNECKDGFIVMAPSHMNTGIILVPDSCNLTEEMKERVILVANYNTTSDKEKERINEMFSNRESSSILQQLYEEEIGIDGTSKIAMVQSSTGLTTIVTFIAIYLGIIFLIASSAILALKQLTESSDNRQRYTILRKIGCDEKMINKALFRQIGIFFGLPLILAIIHSIFGIQFALTVMEGIASAEELLPSIIVTVIVMSVIYGAYFLATYLGSKNIIKEEET